MQTRRMVTNGRYVSYWNAFLLINIDLVGKVSEVKESEIHHYINVNDYIFVVLQKMRDHEATRSCKISARSTWNKIIESNKIGYQSSLTFLLIWISFIGSNAIKSWRGSKTASNW